MFNRDAFVEIAGTVLVILIIVFLDSQSGSHVPPPPVSPTEPAAALPASDWKNLSLQPSHRTAEMSTAEDET